MANTGFSGIDVRQIDSRLLFRAYLQDANGNDVTSGTTSLYLYELQDDGTLKSYDFNDNTFKTTALTTETTALTHRTGNNSTTNTGVWTAALTTLTGFTVGGIYLAKVTNTGAAPPGQVREFQFGSEQGNPPAVFGSVSDGAPATGDFDGAAGLSSSDDFYNNAWMVFTSGTLKGITRKIDDYTGSSRNFVFTTAAWPTAPANGDKFMVVGHS